MTIPRSWTPIEYQRSPQQTNTIAKPSGTDMRFKAGGFLAFLAWCTICYSLQHSIHHYKPQNRGPVNSFRGFLCYCPLKFLLVIPLLLMIISYTIASSFVWTISILKFDVDPGWMYGLDSGPALLIILIFEIRGYIEPNEDRALIEQRAERGRAHNAELGLSKKPSWWSRSPADRHLTAEQKLKALTTEIGGGRATARNIERAIELNEVPLSHFRKDLEDPFQDEAAIKDSGDRSPGSASDSDEHSGRAVSVRSTSTAASRPQQIRSMLDI